MKKQKVHNVDELYLQMTKKHCREESILHRVWFHPDINQLVLKYLNIKNIIQAMQCDSNMYKHGSRELKEIIASGQIIRYLSRSSWIFSNVYSMQLFSYFEGDEQELFISSLQYPLLRKLIAEHLSNSKIVVTCSIEELKVCNNIWTRMEVIIPNNTLRKFYCSSQVSMAQTILSNQSRLEEVELVLYSSFADEFISLVHTSDTLRKLSCQGDFFINMASIEHLEELCLHGADVSILNPCKISNVRFMEISGYQRLENVLGNTEFPHLNFFSVQDLYDELVAQKIYNGCITKSQDALEVYSSPKQSLYLAERHYTYCSNLKGIHMISASRNNEKMLYVHQVPDLKILNGLNASSHFMPNTSLQSLEIVTSSVEDLCKFLKPTPPQLQLILPYETCNQLSSTPLASVKNLKLKIVSGESAHVILGDVSSLQSLYISSNSISKVYLRFLHVLSSSIIRIRLSLGSIFVATHLHLHQGEEQQYCFENSFQPSPNCVLPEVIYDISSLEYHRGEWAEWHGED